MHRSSRDGWVTVGSAPAKAPVTGLDADVTPVEVRFQQQAYAVDDLVVVGRSQAGEHRLLLAVRRNPIITGRNACASASAPAARMYKIGTALSQTTSHLELFHGSMSSWVAWR
jgi:hypothetical protein